MTRPRAFAAPVEVGMMFAAAARAPEVAVRAVLQVLICRVGVNRGHETTFDAEVVHEDLGKGARQFVVHDALEMMSWIAGS